MAPSGKLRTKKRGLKSAPDDGGPGNAAEGKVDPASVFVRGLPGGTADGSLRAFFEARVGPVAQCFVIRDDYGLATFKDAADARRCLEECQGVEYEGSSLRLQAAKPKRHRAQRPGPVVAAPPMAASEPTAASSSSSSAKAGRPEGFGKQDLRSVQLTGVPQGTTKEALRTWIEQQLPGGCGIEGLQRRLVKDSQQQPFVVHFRKEANARRAVEVLEGAKFNGHALSAGFRALELARQSDKAGRLIVRNLSFSATAKHVRKAFEKLGSLSEVNVPAKDGATGSMNRGFAFVQFTDSSVAQKAVDELNGTKICGRGVAVDWAVQSELYQNLQREEKQEPVKKPRASKESSVEDKPAKADADEDGDEQEGEEEEDDEEGEDEEEEEEDEAAKGDASAEVKRMKGLMGDEGKDDEAEDAKPKKEAKPKDKKDLRKPGFDVDEKRTIFVRNVPFDATAEDLKEALRKFGKVANVKLVADAKGQNAHRGSAFVKFVDVEGAKAALEEEAQADKKLKELSAVVRKSDRRELPAVEGFGISLKGRRLVLKPAVSPKEATELAADKKPKKGVAMEEKAKWKYLLTVGDISENSEKWERLSKSEQLQRKASKKERKWRIGNANFVIHPMRLSIRNLPVGVDVPRLREEVVRHLCTEDLDDLKGVDRKKKRQQIVQNLIVKASLVRNAERREAGGVRRSRGFGFMEFKNHETALKVLDYLNDNPKAFGGTKRPIVQFAIEDKRMLRMQQELFEKHAHKVLNGKDAKGKEPVQDLKGGAAKTQSVEEAGGKAGGKADGKGGGKGRGKGGGKGKDGGDEGGGGDWNYWKPKKKKKEGESRGRRQREKRRQQKAETAEKEKARATSRAQKAGVDARKKAEEAVKRSFRPKPKGKIPDADASVKKGKRTRQEWDIPDDFELKAMEKFRR